MSQNWLIVLRQSIAFMNFPFCPMVAVYAMFVAPMVFTTSAETFTNNSQHNLDSQDPTRLPNVGYLLSGYHIFKGNPQSTTTPGVDPGFTTAIYESVLSTKTTGDGRYSIPDHTNIKKNVGCAVSFNSDATFKQSEYEDSLASSVSSDFKGYGIAAFSASADYKKFAKRTSSEKLRMVSSIAECTVYTGSVDAFTPPKLTDNFLKGMEHLPKDYVDGTAYFDFFDVFGTHAVSQMTMGARFGFTSYLSEQSWTKIEETGVSVATAAKYQGTVQAGGSVNTTTSKKAQEEFSKNSQYESVITLGAKPTTTDAKEWAKSVIDEPMPIKYSLRPICDVLKSADIVANCKMAMKEYCSKRLQAQGLVENCEVPDDISLACLWDSDCGSGPGFQCVNHRCKQPSPRPAEIHNNDRVFLKHIGSGEYIKDVKAAGVRKDWPHGRLGDPRGEFQLLFSNPVGPTHGDGQTLVRIRSMTTTTKGYDFMYSSEQGGVYFDQDDQSNDKQWWKVSKVGCAGDDDVLRQGDIVRFQNKYSGLYLQKYEYDYVYALAGEDNWQLQISSSIVVV